MMSVNCYDDLMACEKIFVEHKETKGKAFEFNVDIVVKKKNPTSRRLSLTLDFTFNKLRQIRKI